MKIKQPQAKLILEDGTIFNGQAFGYPESVAGEVVFNTGMVGYPESFTDPSYKGQILTLTYPLIGNYGIPNEIKQDGLAAHFESDRIQIQALVVSEYSENYSHWNSAMSLADWLTRNKVPAICGIDTRSLTKRLRSQGTMLGKIEIETQDIDFYDPNAENLVANVSIDKPAEYGFGAKRVVLIDCGCKYNIIKSLVARNVRVLRVPWDYDFIGEAYHGVLISNGPGNPKTCRRSILNVRKAMNMNRPILGICLGNQILALAAGANTYKLKFGHRSQNQPCIQKGSNRCYITSQNHGFAVDDTTLPEDWEPWFINANDGTNEGIRHRHQPFMSVQFHPEAAPGPVDTAFLFDQFIEMLGDK
ncbi:glutamine-hydrolyzing carbamoyl-phosphate synthase small subunit [candidate division KSB1 bacterium]|nr:glutamine-hydrolyzing carbamoyl-phosphate synthase small subunit [candidate division KSB1 bacterium]